uniref:T33-27.1 : A n=1 Tax=synthetic construct TaxID=32630 RepID=UPI0031384A22
MTMADETIILNVLGQYTRAHDRRDPDAMAALFAPDASIVVLDAVGGASKPISVLHGRDAIRVAVRQMMAPHGYRAWSQNVVNAPVIHIHGDTARLDAQFMVFSILAAEVPDGGWPTGTFGAQGRIVPIEAGTYTLFLRTVPDGWVIAHMVIKHRLPMAFG